MLKYRKAFCIVPLSLECKVAMYGIRGTTIVEIILKLMESSDHSTLPDCSTSLSIVIYRMYSTVLGENYAYYR